MLDDCPTRLCAIKRGLLHCGECENFPCRILNDFYNDGNPMHFAALENMCEIVKMGADKWLMLNELIVDVQSLLDTGTYISKPLLKFVNEWLTLTDGEKADNIPSLHIALVDGLDCDFTGTQWEEEWLANGKVCLCAACEAARKCISTIEN